MILTLLRLTIWPLIPPLELWNTANLPHIEPDPSTCRSGRRWELLSDASDCFDGIDGHQKIRVNASPAIMDLGGRSKDR